MAILFAIKYLEHYLMVRHFIVRTDHMSLKYLIEQKLTTPTQQAWLTKLQQHDYEIRYKKRIENRAADALSRTVNISVSAIVVHILPDQLLTAIRAAWKEETLRKIIADVQKDPALHPKYN